MKYLLLSIFFVIQSTAWSYPLFVNCNEGRMESTISTDDLQTQLLEMAQQADDVEAMIQQYCQGLEDCMRDFRGLMEYSRASVEVVQELTQNLVEQTTADRDFFPRCVHRYANAQPSGETEVPAEVPADPAEIGDAATDAAVPAPAPAAGDTGGAEGAAIDPDGADAVPEVASEGTAGDDQEAIPLEDPENCVDTGPEGQQMYDLYRQVADLGQDIQTCNDAKSASENVSDRRRFRDSSGNVIIYYPFDEARGHISGCNREGSRCRSILGADNMRRGIRKALIMGVDPYMAIAISVMEKTAQDFETGLTWDNFIPPNFWLRQAMGCPSSGSRSGRAIYTDSTPGTGQVRTATGGRGRGRDSTAISARALTSRLRWFLRADGQGQIDETTNSYLCYQQTYHSDGRRDDEQFGLRTAPDPSMCCLTIGFTPTGDTNVQFPRMVSAMMFEYQRQLSHSPTHEERNPETGDMETVPNTDPAHNIQYYQGYSELMGGGEPVNPARAGYDLHADPHYGYQVMDFMLNSLVTNPEIRRLVEEEQQRAGVERESLLCVNNPDGIRVYDTDEYIDRKYSSPRMQSVQEAHEGGQAFRNLRRPQQQVMLTELADPAVLAALRAIPEPNNLSPDELRTLGRVSQIDSSNMTTNIATMKAALPIARANPNDMGGIMDTYFEHVYNSESTPRSSYSDVTTRTGERLTDEEISSRAEGFNHRRSY